LCADGPIPFPRDWSRIVQLAAAILISASFTALLMKWSERRNRPVAGAQEILVTGEVLDMTCYIASNLSGPDHAECARVCIRNGLPVGIKAQNGKVYLLTGEPVHSVNVELADYAAKTVTIQRKANRARRLRATSSRRNSEIVIVPMNASATR
jgi:hypothetical protein